MLVAGLSIRLTTKILDDSKVNQPGLNYASMQVRAHSHSLAPHPGSCFTQTMQHLW